MKNTNKFMNYVGIELYKRKGKGGRLPICLLCHIVLQKNERVVWMALQRLGYFHYKCLLRFLVSDFKGGESDAYQLLTK